MEAAGCFPCDKELAHAGFAVDIDLHPTVLVVQSRINQDGILRDVDFIPLVLTHHGWKMFLQRSRALVSLKERRVQPDADSAGHRPDPSAFLAFPNDRGRHDVTGVQLIDEPLSFGIDQVAAFRADAFGDERTDKLLGIDSAAGMVLKRVDL
jgi:hypothetical protein